MVSYIIAKIISINKCSITVENNFVGYNILVNNKERFEIGKFRKIFLYKNISINSNKIVEEMFGFENYEQKELFLKLLQISGIGCKTSMQIISHGCELIKQLISNNDIEGLSKLKGISLKVAKSLCENIEHSETKSDEGNFAEAFKALLTLGYPQMDVQKALQAINTKQPDVSDIISDAIR
jgi:Holliday junction DNA helicase RuvA